MAGIVDRIFTGGQWNRVSTSTDCIGEIGVRVCWNWQWLTVLKLQIKPVQKQTRAGQRTRFKAVVVIGDSEGHVGLGIKTSKEVATAIRAAIIIAKLSVLPVRRGYWGTNLGEPHSLPVKQSGKCGSVTVRVCYIQISCT